MSVSSFRKRFLEVAIYFLRLGLTGFGGPLSLISIMQKDLVETRKWISLDEFQQAFALIKSMPGPAAFQTAVYLGRKRAGLVGGALAGIFIILPAAILVVFAAHYLEVYGKYKPIQNFLIGMQTAAVVTIAFGLKSFFVPYLKKSDFWMLLIASAYIFYKGLLPESLLIIGGASLWVIVNKIVFNRGSTALPMFAFVASGSPNLSELIKVCVKAGAIVFGTGIAIVPILESDFVQRLHWLTHSEFMNALAIGQITPGPVMISVTYIGYKLFGIKGAVIATGAVFGPSFFHMMSWFPSAIQYLSRQKWIQHFVFAATSIILGTVAVSIASILSGFHDTAWCYIVLILTALIEWHFRLPAWALIPLGGVFGEIVPLFF